MEMEKQSKKRKVTFDPTTLQVLQVPVTSTFETSAANSSSKSSNDDINLNINLNLNHPSRFEAYKRCSIARSDALSNFITACLIHSHKVTSNQRINNLSLIGGTGGSNINTTTGTSTINNGEKRTGDNYTTSFSSTGNEANDGKESRTNDGEDDSAKTNPSLENNNSSGTRRPNTNNSNDVHNNTNINHHTLYNPLNNDITSISTLKLHDIVAPGAASKITSVVSTLSKIHAQRLIKSARAIATSQGYKEDEKILPHHLMEAHRVMTQYGGGGGGTFFMQPTRKQMKGLSSHSLGRSGNLDGHCSVVISGIDRNLIQYQAAMEAQNQYDEIMMNQFSSQEVSVEGSGDDNVNDIDENKA